MRLWLSVIAYNLGNLWRRLALPRRIGNWSLTSLQQWLMKTGGRLVRHARYYWLLLAESHLTWRLFGAMVGRIEALPVPAGQSPQPARENLGKQAGGIAMCPKDRGKTAQATGRPGRDTVPLTAEWHAGPSTAK